MAKSEDTSRQPTQQRGTKPADAPAPGSTPPGSSEAATGAPADPNAPAMPAAGTPKPRAKIVRVSHPALNVNEKGETTTKLKAWPTDFSSVKHKALKPTDFESEGTYLRQQADMLEQKAALLRQQASDCDTLGDTATRAMADKMRKRMAEINELMSGLQGKGVDVKAMVGNLLAKLGEKMEAKAAAVGADGQPVPTAEQVPAVPAA